LKKNEDEKHDFSYWKLQMESDDIIKHIDRPLLLISSHDDPLHLIDLIGTEETPSNPYIAYYLTKVWISSSYIQSISLLKELN
jgi:predicted alpha/beta-fold hydrolase